jgi:hypothetical protein
MIREGIEKSEFNLNIHPPAWEFDRPGDWGAETFWRRKVQFWDFSPSGEKLT